MSTYNNMVSYYNALPYSQKHSVGYPGGQWQWPTNYHAPTNHQFITDNNSPPHHHQMYYNPHHMFHPAASAADWHGPATDNFTPNMQNHMLQQVGGGGGVSVGGGGGGGSNGSGNSNTPSMASAAAAASAIASTASVSPSVTADLSMVTNNIAHHSQLTAGLPSPPITVSGSELSSPGAPASSSSPQNLRHHNMNNSNGSINGNANANGHHTKCNRNNVVRSGNNSPSNNNNNNNNNNNLNRRSPTKSPYYEWMKKPSYPAQPTPGSIADDDLCNTAPSLQDFTTDLEESGKTRTKDKYRVVYSDYQRLELEKEYCTSRYITIRRKTELAGSLQLSERQVKIWFQNRRAKERKQSKKNNEQAHVQAQALTVQQVQEHVQAQHLHVQHVQQHVQHPDLSSYMDTKPKIEPGLHPLQHPALHQMSSMAMLHGHHHYPLAMAHAHTHTPSHSHVAHTHSQHLHQAHAQLSPTALAM